MLFRKKSITVQATQWLSNGDHPNDNCEIYTDQNGAFFKTEGNVVRYYRHPRLDGKDDCKHCNTIMQIHGWIDTLEGGHIVCPGDWIITGIKGEYYPCKPDIFEATYERIEE